MKVMKRLVTITLIATITVGLTFQADAQHFSKKKQYWSIGGSINANHYVGDVTASKNRFSVPFKFTRENIGICALKRLTPRMSARGNFFYGTVKGNDRELSSEQQAADVGRWERGSNFKNTLYELSFTAIFDFYENRGTWKKRPDYTPYAFVGLAAFYQNPKMSASSAVRPGDWVSISSMPHLGGSKFQGALVYGLGFRYKLDKRWDLALEIGWRKSTTDKMDGVWGNYYEDAVQNPDGSWDLSAYTDAEIAYYDNTASAIGLDGSNAIFGGTSSDGRTYTNISSPGELRGKPALDGYIVTGLHLTRILGGGVICPKFR